MIRQGFPQEGTDVSLRHRRKNTSLLQGVKVKGLLNLLEAKTTVGHNDRLRVGNYRILFEIEDDAIVIYRVKHRRDAYSS